MRAQAHDDYVGGGHGGGDDGDFGCYGNVEDGGDDGGCGGNDDGSGATHG